MLNRKLERKLDALATWSAVGFGLTFGGMAGIAAAQLLGWHFEVIVR